jgi:hypothetical protein
MPPDARQVSDLPEESPFLQVCDLLTVKVGDLEGIGNQAFRQVKDLPRITAAKLQNKTIDPVLLRA